MLYMGVDLGGTGIKAGVVSENGEILSKGSTPTMKERPYQDIIRDIAALCEKVAGQANVTMDEIAAIGVGVPGICDAKTGIIPFCTNLGWHDVPFIAEMHKYLPNRVIVDNDATVAAMPNPSRREPRHTVQRVYHAGHGRGRRYRHWRQAVFRRAWDWFGDRPHDHQDGRRTLHLRQQGLF